MVKILITGGAGFIGSSLTVELLRLGFKVTILDNLSAQVHGDLSNSYTYNLIRNRVKVIVGDVTHTDDWEYALKDQDVVIHLAAETGTGQSMYETDRYTDTNVTGTANLLRLLVNRQFRPHKVIVASSRAVYGEGKYFCSEHGPVFPGERSDKDMSDGNYECRCPKCDNYATVLPSDEETSCNPTSVYGITKLAQEQLVMKVCRQIGIPSTGLRFQNVYGPGQSLKNSYTGVLAVFSNLLRENLPVNIFEDGKESRDFVYISDVVNSIILAITRNEAGYNIFNVGSGIPVRIVDMALSLKGILNSSSEIIISGNFRSGDIRHNVADITKIKSVLNFIPLVTIDEGLKEFAGWVTTQGRPGNKGYSESIKELKERGLFR